MKSITRRSAIAGLGTAALLLGRTEKARAGKNYDVGVTDSEIKLGTTSPYSGPASAYGVYGQAQSAYFEMVNDRGGINGRKINLISLDNAFNPPKAVEQTRKLVESDEVFAIAGFLGTPPNAAVSKYLNAKGVPSLFLTSGALRFNDPKNFPWIVPFYPSYIAQGAVFGRYILKAKPNGKVAVQYVNDDLGRDFLRGLKLGLGNRAAEMIVAELGHEMAEPTIENQIVELKASGADVLVQLSASKFAAQAIRKVASLGWHPTFIINSNSSSVGGTLEPAGLENSKGLITARWEKNVTDPAEADDEGVKAYKAFAQKYMPRLNLEDATAVPGYNNAAAIEHVLKLCGDNLTRENLLKQATSLKDYAPPLILSGVKVYNSPDNYDAFHNMQLAQFDGKKWGGMGEMISLEDLTITSN
jgi:ABC-type branched-subunit amino acid transport system substrate-binding protein